MSELKDITLAVNVLALQVGEFLREQQRNFDRSRIQTKSMNSLVSYVDIEAEKMLVNGLKNILPEAGFITEEDTVADDKKELLWVIDPLDGTTNFMHGLPLFAISIALMKGKEGLVGVVYEVGHDELFYAWNGGGAYLNSEPVFCSAESKLGNSLMATGFPYHDFSKMPEYISLLQTCFRKTRGVRRFGSAATDLAYVACGRFNGFFEYGLSPWDVAAGSILVQEAGGFVCDFKGGNDFVFGKQILAGGKNIQPELQMLVSEHLG